MLEHGCWTGRMELALARKWQVTRRQVRNYVAEARELIRDELDSVEQDRAERRRMFMARLRAGQREMHRDRNWASWVKAMQLESSIVSAAASEPAERPQPVSPAVADTLAAALGWDSDRVRLLLGVPLDASADGEGEDEDP